MGERFLWTALFFPLGFDEVAHDSGRRKGHIVKDEPCATSSHNHLLFFSRNCWRAHSAALIQRVSARRPPTFTRRNAHLEDVVPPTRQRGKTFCNRLTDPQWGVQNSKPRPVGIQGHAVAEAPTGVARALLYIVRGSPSFLLFLLQLISKLFYHTFHHDQVHCALVSSP